MIVVIIMPIFVIDVVVTFDATNALALPIPFFDI